MTIPQDPIMLMSFINMKLRDGEFSGLKDFCDSNGLDQDEIIKKLGDVGFEYSSDTKQFR